jgi:UDP-N-acetylglucosamine--N-acetylmuramyl-(pentapeptide) pyrophosphoryl-undecaprenol N-acetylglucosamine transferase
MDKTIVFTGGGTAGHVTPNIALIHKLKPEGWKVFYIGSKNGIEKDLIEKNDIPFYSVRTGKLRRYFSWKNFIDPFNILIGTIQAFYYLGKLKPHLVFSKGGFVGFPVVLAAWVRRIPVIAHESDLSPGLATRLSYPFVSHVCVTFEKAKHYFKRKEKVLTTGTPIRESLLSGDRKKGMRLCAFEKEKPCILIIGGGQGADKINETLRLILDKLLVKFNIIHLCGREKIDETKKDLAGYRQFEYVDEELAHLYALSSIVISRSGANSVYEILALGKPHLFIPLSLRASRGDQIQNARYFMEKGVSDVLDEDKLTQEKLYQAVIALYEKRAKVQKSILSLNVHSGTDNIIELIKKNMSG